MRPGFLNDVKYPGAAGAVKRLHRDAGRVVADSNTPPVARAPLSVSAAGNVDGEVVGVVPLDAVGASSSPHPVQNTNAIRIRRRSRMSTRAVQRAGRGADRSPGRESGGSSVPGSGNHLPPNWRSGLRKGPS